MKFKTENYKWECNIDNQTVNKNYNNKSVKNPNS
jgi:hypothetical protein